MATKGKTILYIRSELSAATKVGGSVAHTQGVTQAMINNGNKIIFVSPWPFFGLKSISTKVIHPSLFRVLAFGLGSYLYNFYAARRIRKIIYGAKPDLVYSRYALYSDLPVRVAKRLRIPLVLEFNGSEVWVAKNWNIRLFSYRLAEQIERRCLAEADLIVVISEALKDTLLKDYKVANNKILVNPNGVDAELYSKAALPSTEIEAIKNKYELNKTKLVAGYIGTFGPWHGVSSIIKLAKMLIERRALEPNEIKFLLVGDGVEMPKIKKTISKYNLEPYFILTGLVPQSKGPLYISLFDIALNPTVPNKDGSEFFGSPTKLFEYMSFGKAIISSNIGQMGTILKHKTNALLFDPEDTETFYQALSQALDNPEIIRNIGREARKDVLANFTWNKNVERTMNRLEELRGR